MQFSDEQKIRIVGAYKNGEKIHNIKEEFGVEQSALYRILGQAGVLPDRANRSEKPNGSTEALASLYEILTSREQYVKQLEALLEVRGVPLPEVDQERVDEMFREIIAGPSFSKPESDGPQPSPK